MMKTKTLEKEIEDHIKALRKSSPQSAGAYNKQIGGSHYKDMKIQPSQFINENKLPFAEGSAIKYICRHASKGKEEDIDKAIHYLEMIKERDYQ